ncbi:MAG: hypothetical protein C0483_07490 [Pirellula sp.]|nr:hypothetical protein [Pirellula sp.]
MSSELITKSVWKELTRAAKKSRRASLAAVAYFGRGASKLLPLRPKSRLVVDAGEAAVKSGQTCPAELLKLQKIGVRIFSAPNLHAKLFVFGQRAFIGSTNVSNRSANMLIEALLATTDAEAVKAARTFAKDLCVHELGPDALQMLQLIYRPPRVPGNRATPRRSRVTKNRIELPKLRIAQLTEGFIPDGSESAQESGERAAISKRQHRRTHEVQDFWWTGNCPFRVRDTVVQVLKEEDGRKFVSPPGNVLHLRHWRRGRKRVTFVYLEVPNRRRVLLGRLAKQLGYGAKKRLGKGGQVRDADLAKKLLTAWDR